ncbi:MAG: GTPase [Proteobacteria bacterium]|nr:GTPase [Pseudomonadota bacterium]
MVEKVVIMGAAGKDFHVFNTVFRGKDDVEVVAFTATQNPGIAGRRYPPELAGPGYPDGIPILPEEELVDIIASKKVDRVVFSYSDVRYTYVGERRQLVEEAGAVFETAPVEPTMLPSSKPVVAICAVRTGVGKSQTTRRVSRILRDMGLKVVACRHPMPYGDLTKQRLQRFATLEDLEKHDCTIEEMEEYEPHIRNGCVVYAGVDYEAILRSAEKEADVILWDGGNNDTPFFKPTVHITLVDPLRPGHELTYYPGRENLERADVILFNKMDSAKAEDVETVKANVIAANPEATIVYANSPCTVDDPSIIEGKRVLVVEDGPTLTHGEMKYGAGVVAAKQHNAAEIVDPRPWVVGEMAETFEHYPDIGHVLPAMGYGDGQMADLASTIDRCDCEAVVIGTPIDLGRIIKINKPNTRVTYELEEISKPDLTDILGAAIGKPV